MRIMFICHGNICRSPLAEFMLKNMVSTREIHNKYKISSCATSFEELGEPIHYEIRKLLSEKGIPFSDRRAVRLEKSDYANYDLFICMDKYNLRNAMRILNGDPENKLHLLMEYANEQRDVQDPWYTRNFTDTYNDISAGLEGLLSKLEGR